VAANAVVAHAVATCEIRLVVVVSLEHRYREMHRVIAPAQLTLALE
jgi:hypothetical protein